MDYYGKGAKITKIHTIVQSCKLMQQRNVEHSHINDKQNSLEESSDPNTTEADYYTHCAVEQSRQSSLRETVRSAESCKKEAPNVRKEECTVVLDEELPRFLQID